MCIDITRLRPVDGYEIKRKYLSDVVSVLVLSKVGKDDFIGDWIPKKKDRLKGLEAILAHINNYSLDHVLRNKMLRYIPELGLYELKHYFGADRIMCHIDEKTGLILLFDFTGHKGQSSGVDRSVKEKAVRLKKVAREILRKEGQL
jgi:hypothetical protein